MFVAMKVLGSVLILVSGLLLGISCSSRLAGRCRELDCLDKALLHLKTEISYGLTPLPRALQVSGEVAGGLVGRAFSKASELVGRRGGMVPSEALRQALSGAELAALGPEVRNVILEMATCLGTSGRSEQIALLDATRERLRILKENAADDAARYGKLYRHLGILGAVVLVLLLV
ncbi:MAG: stage III sporulation protein AB [Firmicutes bacterium]|nr:stage III sporulation protein AB [Candidatus Fermentithermobacillaceae bacterium]